MADIDDNRKGIEDEPESLDLPGKQKDLQNRREFETSPETGWKAGQGISNAQFIRNQLETDDLNSERGPSDAGIGMAEIKKKQDPSEEQKWGSGSGSGLKGTAGSEAGTH